MLWVMPVLLLPLAAWGVEGGFTDAEAQQIGEALTKKLGVEPDKQSMIHNRLQSWMTEKREGKFANLPITGVFAYKMGEGGLVVKFTSGKGLLRYYGEDKDHTLKIKGVAAGATAGGSSDHGVGIIMGPNAPMSFGGSYKTTQTGATAGTGGVSTAELTRKEPGGEKIKIVLLGTATGLSASAQGGGFTIEVTD
jgi:hypothetical protein